VKDGEEEDSQTSFWSTKSNVQGRYLGMVLNGESIGALVDLGKKDTKGDSLEASSRAGRKSPKLVVGGELAFVVDCSTTCKGTSYAKLRW